MRVAVASGKGGTGKTTVAVNLARSWGSSVSLLVPAVDAALCDGCGECSRFCEFHAIAATGGAAIVFTGMCHGCGGCARICPRGAIREVEERIGVMETWESGDVELVLGRLDVGASLTPPVVNAVKARARGDQPAILDAPAGTSCPVVATLRGSDFVLLEIPDDRRIAEACSRGRLVVDVLPEYAGLFGSLAEAVRERAGAAA